MPTPVAALARANHAGEQVSVLLASIGAIVRVLESRLTAYASSPSQATADALAIVVFDAERLYGAAVQIGEIVSRDAHASRESLASAVEAWGTQPLVEPGGTSFRDASAPLLDVFQRAEATVLVVKETADRDLQVLASFASGNRAPEAVVAEFNDLIARLRNTM